MIVSPRWKKVWRDLFENKSRTGVVVSAIAVGVFAFGSVFITQDVLINDMNDQYMVMDPTFLTLYPGEFDDGLVKWVKSAEGVTDAQGVTVNGVKLLSPKKTYNMNISTFGDNNDSRLNAVKPESGTWPPNRGEIVLERTTAKLLGYKIGDEITMELTDGEKESLVVGGTVHDLTAIPATMFPQLTGYVDKKTLAKLGMEQNYNQLQVKLDSSFDTEDKVRQIGNQLKERLEDRGLNVGMSIQKPNQHWGADVSKAFTTILSVIGIFSLVLSAFLVINTILAILTQQKKQIGIMKGVGAVGSQVVGIYIVMVVLYGMLGMAVALPIGLGLAYLFTSFVANFLNLNIINFHLPWKVGVMMLTASVLVPLLASIQPIWSNSKLKVVDALRGQTEGRKQQNFLLKAVNRIRGLPRPILLSLRNTFQKQGRLLLTLVTLTVAGMLYLSVVNVRKALTSELSRLMEMYNFDIQFELSDEYEMAEVRNRAEKVEGVEAVESRTNAGVILIKDNGSRGTNFTLTGLPPTSEFVSPTILEGRWLKPMDRMVMVVSSTLAKENPEFKVGKEVEVEYKNKKHKIEVVGVVSISGEKVAFMDFDKVAEIKESSGKITSFLVKTNNNNGEYLDKLAENIKEEMKSGGINVGQFMTIDTITSSNEGQFNFLVMFLLAMAVMVAIVGGLGLAGTMGLNVMERTREIGVMRSIGADNKILYQMVVMEGLIVGLTSWLLAIPLSIPGTWGFCFAVGSAFMQRPLGFEYDMGGLFIWLAVVSAISIVASLLPAKRAASVSIRDTLAYE